MAIIFPKTNKKEYPVCPEGTYVFKIYDAWENKNGTVIVQMVTADGIRHNEFFRLVKEDGTPNSGALNAFAYLAKTALNDFERESMDSPVELDGCYIRGTIEHSTGTNGKTYARMAEKETASGFDTEPTKQVQALRAKHAGTAQAQDDTGLGLEDIL